jgi:hypothetical protein
MCLPFLTEQPIIIPFIQVILSILPNASFSLKLNDGCKGVSRSVAYRQDNVWQVLAFPFRFSAHPLPLFAH